MSSDWDADYGLSQGPIDSDTKLNVDLSPGFYMAEPSEYDLDAEEEEFAEKLLDPDEKGEKTKKNFLPRLKSMITDLEERITALEKEVY